ACSALYVVRDISATHDRPPSSAPVSLPGGLELLTPLADAAEFQRIVGFPPVIPEALPDGTASIPRFHATQPDATGARSGELRFAAGSAGPSILLRESQGSAGDSAPHATGSG